MTKDDIAFINALRAVEPSLGIWAELRLDAGQSLDDLKASLRRAIGVVEDEKKALADAYVERIGYDPFEDDPNITVAEVAHTLAEHDKIEARGGLDA
jgi:hypothetical protein